MKNLTQCEKGCSCKITKLNATGALKQRLMSFGMARGIGVQLLEYSPGKNTVEIKIGKTRLALRKEEAEMIEIESQVK